MKQAFRIFAAYFALLVLGALAVDIVHPNPPRVFAQGDGRCMKDGQEVRCPDGKYHDYHTGEAQPDSCANYATAQTQVKDCDCERAKMEKDACDMPPDPGQTCKTECREHACKCQSKACS